MTASPVAGQAVTDPHDDSPSRRVLPAPQGFSLAETCGPVAWAGGRWPNVDWIHGTLLWVGWEGQAVVHRSAHQVSDPPGLVVTGTASLALDAAWAEVVLGLAGSPPIFADHVVETLRRRFPGLRCYAAGSLFDGLVGSIVGQSISVAAAAVTETRLATLFHEGLALAGRRFWPPPRPDQLAASAPALLRTSGVTGRRAEALVAAACAALDGRLPDDGAARRDPDATRAALRTLPLVGPWTAESALLWGIGIADAFPAGDAALLRAARLSYGRPALDHPTLNRLAAGWAPARGWAARLLWTALLGTAPPSPRE